MNTSFVAFMNKRGIACASDTDMTLYAWGHHYQYRKSWYHHVDVGGRYDKFGV